MVKAVIIQRVVPHYRVPLFRELHKRLGWRVACARSGPSNGLDVARPEDHEWMTGFAFKRAARATYRTWVPMADIMEQARPEALVCEFSLMISSTWRLALGGYRVPFAFWSQGWNRERGFSAPIDKLSQATRIALMRQADAQVAYNEESAEFLAPRLGSEMPIFVARNTLAIHELPGRDIDSSPRDPFAPHIVSVGRLTPDKHVPRVVEAFLRLREALPAARMTVVGDGPDRGEVDAVAARSEGSVSVRGSIYDDAEMAKVFQSASLLVMGGSVGLSVNHALAYGVPVMIFDDQFRHRHHPEHVYVIDGVTGFRVKGEGEEALAAGLREALAPPGPRATLGPSLTDHVSRELSLDRMIEGFEALDAHFATLASGQG